MKFDEKTEKRHKAKLRKLMIFGLRNATKGEIQYELSQRYGLDFDLNYIHKLLCEIEEDREREIAYQCTPEGQAATIRKYLKSIAHADKIIAELKDQKD